MGKKAPPAPDYTKAAEAQGQSSLENTSYQTYANRPNQQTPFGSQTWSSSPTIDPATGKKVDQWTQNTTLNPQSQEALDAQLGVTTGRSQIGAGMMNRVAQEYGPTIDWSKFSPQGTNVQGGNAYDKKAGDAVWNQFESRNEPLFQRQQAQMDATLRNRGLKPGDEAYDQQMKEMGQQQTDARQQAQNQATTMAGQEGSRMQQMDIGASGFNTQNRQQQIAEEMQKRGFSLNEINALLTGQQVQNPNMPSFQNATKADTTQYLPAAQQQYQSGLDSANSQNAFMGSVLGAVASPFSFSPFG